MNEVRRVQPVILCGGSGTRLWPLSRAEFPKQFISLFENESPFQKTLLRLEHLSSGGIDPAAPIIVTGEAHRFLLLDQLHEIGAKMNMVILEPEARNTAPALTMASMASIASGEDPILIVTPADHVVADNDQHNAAVALALDAAEDGSIVLLGVKPNRAETGYGYLRARKQKGSFIFDVSEFIEKPDSPKAEALVSKDSYFWNAGIFVLRASVWLKAIKKFRPDIFWATESAWSSVSDDKSEGLIFKRPDPSIFASIPPESIDYAVMEHCFDSDLGVRMVSFDAGWSDLGTWDSVFEASAKNSSGNALSGEVYTSDAGNNLVYASSRIVALAGVSGLSVIETPDAVLVAKEDNGQSIKNIVNSLQANRRDEHKTHRKVFRPWGWYDVIDQGAGFKVKRILVKPGARLSLQKHEHRAEHWVVVRGVAIVTNGDNVFTLGPNESTYIPLGAIHRLSNSGPEPLEIIEVQSGDYLGEDDIIRLEDNYGRIE